MKVPFSRFDIEVAQVLERNGFVKSIAKKGRMPKRVIDIKLKYEGGKGAVNGIKLISRPSRRIYVGYSDLKKVKHGYGMAVVSTSQGVMTASEARKKKLGGQMLFEIW